TFIRRRGLPFRSTTRLAWPITLFLLWACVSVVWSDDPLLTVRRAAALLIMAAGATAIVQLLPARDILLLTFINGMATILVGVSFEIALGAFHPFEPDYRFWGILDPNFTGWGCSLCLIAIAGLARNCSRTLRNAYVLAFLAVA